MKSKLVFIGIDVDDKAYHVSVVDSKGQVVAKGQKVSRDVGKLLKVLKEYGRSGLRVGYEATYIGYTLCRQLRAKNVDCVVIAPTSIAKAPDERVKNDRIDSLRLAMGLFRSEFSLVAVPSELEEADRQMMRSRSFLVGQKSDLKRHILNQCRLAGIDYKGETGASAFWTRNHRAWLDKRLESTPRRFHSTLSVLIQSLENFERQIEALELSIEEASREEGYKKKVEALSSFKGMSLITAMTVVTEIFDVKRFEHPKKLVSYMGLDIGEYSSGGKQLQFGITKMGNRRLRSCLVEACQMFWTSKTPSKRKQAARQGVGPKFIDIADRCQERLYRKGHRLLAREKPRNKVKVACAREMVGFIWEALQLAA